VKSRSKQRRALLFAGAAWPMLGWAGAARGQANKPPVVIGYLSFSYPPKPETGGLGFAAFKEGLAELGWKDGSQIRIEARWAEGRDDRLTLLTQELVAKKPALIVATNLQVARSVVKEAPGMPLVVLTEYDPVEGGLATSLARPGGMITGLAGFGSGLAGKYLELLLAAAPKVKRVGFLHGPPTNQALSKVLENARRSVAQYSVGGHFAEVRYAEDIEPATSRLAKEGVQGLVVLVTAMLAAERRRVLALAHAQRWPVISGFRAYAEIGALLSYGSDPVANNRRTAYFVDRILKGTKPGDIPFEQPTKFELIVNMKTAKALGLPIPQSIMLQATRVIE
jgi:putative ABC transport system substrate-binding protein